MKLKLLTLAALALAATQASAISINITDFTFSGPVSVSFNDSVNPSLDYTGQAGQFTGTETATSPALRTAAVLPPTSFTAYCTEISQSFSFNNTYQYSMVDGSSYYTAQKDDDLSRLFTATAGFVVDAATSAAMQAAIWEIVYEVGTNYDLTSGDVTVSTTDPSVAAAFRAINGILAKLDDYAPLADVSALTNPNHQDFVLVPSIPEPGTWALMAGGLALLGAASRRRKS